jgi:6-phosphogluconolactonase
MVEVFPSPETVLDAAAERLVAAAAEAKARSGRFALALSGGSTPHGLYRRLAAEPYRSRIEWSSLHVFWGDERCVPPDDEASNYRMAREVLLDRVPIPPEQVHRIRGESEPGDAAREYELTLRAQFGVPSGPPGDGGTFDLILLGMGPDGHTASLFPGAAALLERERWVLAVEGPVAPPRRVTLTPPVIRAAREVVFLVTGAEKGPALQQALASGADPAPLPARVILPGHGMVRWLVDSAAAGSSRLSDESA